MLQSFTLESPAANSSNADAMHQGKIRRRLPSTARQIIQSAWGDITEMPCIEDRRSVLVQIHAIPGAEWYTMTNIYMLLKTQLEKKGLIGDSESATDSDKILFPNLKSKHFRELQTLLMESTNPSQSEQELWAEALHVPREQVFLWVKKQLIVHGENKSTKLDIADEHDTDSKLLPTPEPTVSPEPDSLRINVPSITPALPTPLQSPVTPVAPQPLPQDAVQRIAPSAPLLSHKALAQSQTAIHTTLPVSQTGPVSLPESQRATKSTFCSVAPLPNSQMVIMPPLQHHSDSTRHSQFIHYPHSPTTLTASMTTSMSLPVSPISPTQPYTTNVSPATIAFTSYHHPSNSRALSANSADLCTWVGRARPSVQTHATSPYVGFRPHPTSARYHPYQASHVSAPRLDVDAQLRTPQANTTRPRSAARSVAAPVVSYAHIHSAQKPRTLTTPQQFMPRLVSEPVLQEVVFNIAGVIRDLGAYVSKELRNPTEFNKETLPFPKGKGAEHMAKYDKMFTNFLDNAQKGAYSHIGLTPSLALPFTSEPRLPPLPQQFTSLVSPSLQLRPCHPSSRPFEGPLQLRPSITPNQVHVKPEPLDTFIPTFTSGATLPHPIVPQ